VLVNIGASADLRAKAVGFVSVSATRSRTTATTGIHIGVACRSRQARPARRRALRGALS
jgi:hypothetical protein